MSWHGRSVAHAPQPADRARRVRRPTRPAALRRVADGAPEAHLAQMRGRRCSITYTPVISARRTTASRRHVETRRGSAVHPAARRGRTFPGVTPCSRPAGRADLHVCVAGSAVGSSCVTGSASPTGAPPAGRATRPDRRRRRNPATRVCGTATLTRSAAGSYSVSSGRPGIAMSPSTTGTSATTPAYGAFTT